MATPNDFIPLNPRDYLVLFSLTAGERHGYGIVKEVEEQSAGAVRMDPSNLYRSLKRLIQKGLVVESELRQDRDSEDSRPWATRWWRPRHDASLSSPMRHGPGS
jgi:DNA-binding PadR family transcriptional regulator